MSTLQKEKIKSTIIWTFVVVIVVGFIFGLVNEVARWIFVVLVMLVAALAPLLFVLWSMFYLFYFWYLDFKIRGLYSPDTYEVIRIANSKFSIFYETNIESEDEEKRFKKFKHVYEDVCPDTSFGKLYTKYENLGKE